MRKTEHYQLNQWDLPDRVRMEDFNADNAKIESALAALSGQLEGVGGQMGALVTAENLEAVKTELEKADTKLQNSKLGTKSVVYTNPAFVASGSNLIMDLTELEPKKCAAICIRVDVFGMGGNSKDTFYLNPVDSSGIITGKCLSTMGSSTSGMAVIRPSGPYNILLFPMCTYDSYVGAITFGLETSIGGAIINYAQLTGLALTPASGSLDSKTTTLTSAYIIR